MLSELPPVGSAVRLLRAVRGAEANEIAKLVRHVKVAPEDPLADEFEILIDDQLIIVGRDDIEVISDR